jgi:hypothetical protein
MATWTRTKPTSPAAARKCNDRADWRPPNRSSSHAQFDVIAGDSVTLELADYAAAITARLTTDSLTGSYHNVGNRGPRTIAFRAGRGEWPVTSAPDRLLGRWDATYFSDFGDSPRVFELRNGTAGLEGTVISNTGDYGHFAGQVRGDSFALAHFDGSFVYMLTGVRHGDSLRGVFHAGVRTQTSWIATRSTGASPLKAPTEITSPLTKAESKDRRRKP